MLRKLAWPLEPGSTDGRLAIASDFVTRFHYDLPLLVDPIENPADRIYAGWPERLYIVDERGVIVYKGQTGPFGFHPQEVEAWLAAHAPTSGPSSPSVPPSAAPAPATQP